MLSAVDIHQYKLEERLKEFEESQQKTKVFSKLNQNSKEILTILKELKLDDTTDDGIVQIKQIVDFRNSLK